MEGAAGCSDAVRMAAVSHTDCYTYSLCAAGGGDAFTRLQAQKQQEGGPRDSRVTGPIKAKLPALRPLTPPSSMEGLLVPAHPNDQAHMAMLLNQQPGKLMLTDIQAMTALQTAQHRAAA